MNSINTVVKQILPNGGKKAVSETPAIKMKPAQIPDFKIVEETKPEP